MLLNGAVFELKVQTVITIRDFENVAVFQNVQNVLSTECASYNMSVNTLSKALFPCTKCLRRSYKSLQTTRNLSYGPREIYLTDHTKLIRFRVVSDYEIMQ